MNRFFDNVGSYRESKQSKDALFSHLTYLVLMQYLAKQRNMKIASFHSNALLSHCRTSTSRCL